MKKFFKILKIILCVVLAVLIFGVVLTKCSRNKKEENIAVAYAEEPRAVERVNNQYLNFNSNISTYPFYSFSGIGNATSISSVIATIGISNMPNILFTIECNNMIYENISVRLAYFGNDGAFIDQKFLTDFNKQSGHVTIQNDYHSLQLVIVYHNAQDNPTIDYEFNTNFYFYAGEYVPGFAQGVEAGRQQGIIEGTEQARRGVFANATYDAKIIYDDGIHTTARSASNLTPNFAYTSVNFGTVFNTLPTEIGAYTAENGTFTLNFSDPILYNPQMPFRGSGNTDVMDGTLIDVNNKRYSGEFDYSQGGLFIMDNPPSAPIKAFEVGMGRVLDLALEFWLISDNGNFLAGYNNGYNTGLSEGIEQGEAGGYDKGYNIGLTEGTEAGYAKAVSEGVSQLGLFNGALAFIKIFFQLVTNFLETKIAGDITLGLLVIGLPAAFMIINLAIGLVKKLLGARGASEGDDG